MLFTVSFAEDSGNSIVGSWTMDSNFLLEALAAEMGCSADELVEIVGQELIDEALSMATIIFTFNEDGTFSMYMAEQDASMEGTYTVEGDQIIMTPMDSAEETQSMTFALGEDGTLTLDFGDGDYIFVRMAAEEETDAA